LLFSSSMRTSLAALVLAAPLCANAYVLKLDAAGQAVSWETSPTFVIGPDLAARLGESNTEAAARAAVATYAADLPQLGITLQVGPTHGVGFDSQPGAVNQNEIVAIDSNWPYDENAVAITILTVNPSTGAILDADIALNTAAHAFRALPADSKPGGPYDDLQNTLTHELGHALGLAHNNADATVVMFGGSQQGEVIKRVLKADDQAGLAFLYAQAPRPAGSAASSAGCTALPAGPSAAGCLLLVAMCLAMSRRNLRRRQTARSSDRVSAPWGSVVTSGFLPRPF